MMVGMRPAYSALTPWVRRMCRMPPTVVRYGDPTAAPHSARVFTTATGLMMEAATARAVAPAPNVRREVTQPASGTGGLLAVLPLPLLIARLPAPGTRPPVRSMIPLMEVK